MPKEDPNRLHACRCLHVSAREYGIDGLVARAATMTRDMAKGKIETFKVDGPRM